MQDFSAVMNNITVEAAATVKVGRFLQKTIFHQFSIIHVSVRGGHWVPASRHFFIPDQSRSSFENHRVSVYAKYRVIPDI